MVRVSLNIPDCHIPFQCEKSYNLMLQIAQDVNEVTPIEEVNILGDFLDFYNVSLHPPGPSSMAVRESLKEEIYQGNKKLEELRKIFHNSKIRYAAGNHEFRLIRYIIAKCPNLFKVYSLEELLNFEKNQIEFHQFGKGQLVSCLDTNLYYRHQPYNQGKNCAATTAHNKGISLLFGHTHRIQSYSIVRGDGTEVNVYSTGWLGDRNQPVFDYMDTDDWCLGFTFTYAFSKDDFHVHQLHFKNGRVVYNGTLYEA